MTRITYDNIRNGIRKHVSNYAFADAIIEKLTEKENRTLDLKGVMGIVAALPPPSFKFTKFQMAEIEKSIKLEALFSDNAWETPLTGGSPCSRRREKFLRSTTATEACFPHLFFRTVPNSSRNRMSSE